jgi:hypothetical protein
VPLHRSLPGDGDVAVACAHRHILLPRHILHAVEFESMDKPASGAGMFVHLIPAFARPLLPAALITSRESVFSLWFQGVWIRLKGGNGVG